MIECNAMSGMQGNGIEDKNRMRGCAEQLREASNGIVPLEMSRIRSRSFVMSTGALKRPKEKPICIEKRRHLTSGPSPVIGIIMRRIHESMSINHHQGA